MSEKLKAYKIKFKDDGSVIDAKGNHKMAAIFGALCAHSFEAGKPLAITLSLKDGKIRSENDEEINVYDLVEVTPVIPTHILKSALKISLDSKRKIYVSYVQELDSFMYGSIIHDIKAAELLEGEIIEHIYPFN